MFGLLPKEEKYFDLFNQMAVHIKECTALLKTLFEDASRHQEIADQIKKVEHQCNFITLVLDFFDLIGNFLMAGSIFK